MLETVKDLEVVRDSLGNDRWSLPDIQPGE